MARSGDPWIRLGLDAALLGTESSQVMALRMAKLARGGRAAEVEATRMVLEKAEAVAAWQALALTGALGFTAPKLAARTLAHYRRKVRRNRRRLMRTA